MFVCRIILLIFTLAAFLLQPPILWAAPHKITGDNINVRSDSTTFSNVLGKLTKEEIVEVRSQKYDWSRIKLPARLNCWVAAEFVQITEESRGKIKASNLNLRSLPSRESEIVGLLQEGDKVALKNKKEDWLEVSCYPYGEGWVHSRFLGPLAEEKNIAYLVEKNLDKLTLASQQEKNEIEKEIIDLGQKAVPLIETHLSRLNQNTVYRVIKILSDMAEKEPQLISYFFNQISWDYLPKSTIYLDVLENILLKGSPKIPFYYLAQQGKLSRRTIQNAYNYLKEKNKNHHQ